MYEKLSTGSLSNNITLASTLFPCSVEQGLDQARVCRQKFVSERKGLPKIASAERLEGKGIKSAVSLLFAPGERPRAKQIHALAANSTHFSISLDTAANGGQEEGWLELLANGMTFDLTGLEPLSGSEVPPSVHTFGTGEGFDPARYEAILIQPGPHLAAGGGMFPVVRTLAMVAASVAQLDNVKAVAWHAARAVSNADYFRRSVTGWIEGGAFPGLGLAALFPTENGGLQSEGLALFTGQELYMTPEVVTDRAEASKIALRLLNWLVENGRVTQSFLFTTPSGETLRLEPIDSSGIVEVWRGAH